jgi:hypothetical protein
MSRHELFNPAGMAPATGFSYGAITADGKVLHIAGITGHREDGTIDDGLVDQFRTACESVASASRRRVIARARRSRSAS